MDARLQRRVQRYGWDKAEAFYEESWKRQLQPAQERLLEMAELRPGERVLDVACGTGLVTLPAARAVGTDGEVVATDLSDRMVEACREASAGLNHVRVHQMDAEDLDVPDASFDCALCSLGLMYVPDPIKSLQELYRVLKPGGRAVVSVWGERQNCGWAEVFPIVDRRVSSEVCPLFFQLGSPDALSGALRRANFERVRDERIHVELRYDSPDHALGAIFAGGPVALAYFKFDASTRDGAHAEYLASIEAYGDGNGFSIPGEFVVACGVRG